ncbi:hypothetical protein AgCh_032264 [Apium graveolens]
MEKNKKSPHALVLPYPAQGHINPMLQFCKRLVSKGIKVSLANTIYISKSMLADPLSFISFETYSDGFDEGGYAQAGNSIIYLSTLRTVGSQTLENLLKKLDESGNPVNVLIYDGFLPWALDVANNFGLVKAVFFTQSCAINNIYYHVYKGLISLPQRDDESSVISVPGLPLFRSWEAPAPLHYTDVLVDQFSNVDDADWVFFNTFHKLEEEWLEDKPNGSVIYVSFGSAARLEVEQIREIARGLEQSNFNFLWVVRESEQTKLPILEAISLGVPIVGMPQWTDQPANAKYVEDIWGIGVRTRPYEKGIVKRKVLESLIRDVMKGEKGKTIKKRVANWKILAKEAVDEGGTSDRNITEFAAELLHC